MAGLFSKTKKRKKADIHLDLSGLLRQLDQTKEEIDAARNHFEQAVDPTLIDCYIYEINAAQLRYQFLLRRFKAAESRFPGALLPDSACSRPG